jgi:predicted  nucleic acid-binding Zn-ribbon protein
MNGIMQKLFELQSLEFEETIQPNTEERILKLRAKIPGAILSHYDRLCASGKKGVALLRDQICTGCHLRVPLGVVLELKHGEDIRLCENCTRYLYLPREEAETATQNRRKPRAQAHEIWHIKPTLIKTC